MTETIESTGTAPEPKKAAKAAGGLNAMLLADLKTMAGGMGIKIGTMKKAEIVEAIKAAQGQRAQSAQAAQAAPAAQPAAGGDGESRPRRERKPRQRGAAATEAARTAESGAAAEPATAQPERATQPERASQRRNQRQDQKQDQRAEQRHDQSQADQRTDDSENRAGRQDQGGRQDQTGRQNGHQDQAGQHDQQDHQDDGEAGGRRSRRRRGRDRERSRTREAEPDVREDDVLVPAAGILDVLDNYAFVRTSGYLPGPDDVYLSLSMVRKLGLRRGDAIVGQVRQPREGERKEKFNPMVRIDSVNGAEPSSVQGRVEFAKLTPLYPSERLRLETDAHNMIGRVIDIAAPIGKGQRGLIVSPAKAGKTMVMQQIANSITTNNPECHLMVVLVDERPEEVTDFERSVKGEVISSTFDRPPADHTIVAELAIERAKRLVELGHDVVVLLDGITRLGRAYNLAAPASGRILSGGVDSAALYPPKRFFGAARNIENGGSLTILATALIESGSKMDEVIFEEFKGTGNMEIRLRRDFAEKRLFPAIDVVASGTRREELLMSKEELAIVWKLRKVLAGLEGQQALELLLERLKKTHSNIEFLMQVQKTTPAPGQD